MSGFESLDLGLGLWILFGSLGLVWVSGFESLELDLWVWVSGFGVGLWVRVSGFGSQRP